MCDWTDPRKSKAGSAFTGAAGGAKQAAEMLGGIGMPSSRALAIGAGAFATFLLVKNSMVITEAGMIYLIQNHLTGALDVYTDPGLHRRMPFFSSVHPYRQVITSTFEGGSMIKARFADTYVGTIPVTFRFKLPLDAERVRKLHREFRSEENLVASLLMRNAQNVTVITATQARAPTRLRTAS